MAGGDPRDVTRREFGGLAGRALGVAALGLTGVLSWRYAAWSSPGPGEVVFQPVAPRDTEAIRQLGRVILIGGGGDGSQPRALSARCSHLGCTVAPSDDGAQLVCPCHGSRYGLDGAVLQGPARESLTELAAERLDDGSVRVSLD